MNLLLINDNSAHPNWGAQATVASLFGILRAAMPSARITALSHAWLRRRFRQVTAPVLGTHVFVPTEARLLRSVVHRCSKLFEAFPGVADDFEYFADEWMAGRGGKAGKEFLALARDADIVVYNGENSIYRNTDEGCHALFLLWLAKRRLGKRACIVNHTAHLDDVRPIMRAMVKKVLPVLDLAAVREPRSLKNLIELGIDNAELYPDVVFAAPKAEPQPRAVVQGGPYFCLSASGLPMSAPRDRYDGAVTTLVRRLKTVVPQAVLVARDPSCQFLEEVARRTDSVFFGPENHFSALTPLFEAASFLVSGHYHYVVFAALAGCPFIPLSANNHKMAGVCEHLGWHRQEPFDATDLASCSEAIAVEASRLVVERGALSSALRQRAARLRVEAMGLGDRVASFACHAAGAEVCPV